MSTIWEMADTIRAEEAQVHNTIRAKTMIACTLIAGERPIDTRVVLFVKLRPGLVLDAALEERIRRQVRDNTTPRHVPARIVQVPDIPRTRNGKVVELAVRSVVHGMPVKHTDALANPEALALFENMPELEN